METQAHILLSVLAKTTRVDGDPIVVFELQKDTELTRDQLRAAWRELSNRGLIDAYPGVHAARINHCGIAALRVTDTPVAITSEVASLTSAQRALLDELVAEYSESPAGINAPRFLSRHEDQIVDAEDLVRRRLVDRIDDQFTVRLPTLSEMAGTNPRVESLWFLAGHVFSAVRQLYKVRPGDPIKVATITVSADLPAPKVIRGLLVLRRAPIWAVFSENLSKIGDLVTPSESILNYKTLADIVRTVSASGQSASTCISAPRNNPAETGPRKKAFIVHGHDSGAKETVARLIEKLGFEAIILHERANMGRTIITKFHEESASAGFAIVLMTPDDVGKAASETELKYRARQNVVFELGFFIGKLGSDKVVAMVKGTIQKPSDLDGVLYISLDEPDWPMKLARELHGAGFAIDWNKIVD